tara:strand:+ start:360 stop:1205 length:846 start_codon:yes stop_codon:yes gene_type:complete
MAVSRGIRTIYVTNYDKSIGDVLEYLASGSGDVPLTGVDFGLERHADRSDVTGVHEISIAQPLTELNPLFSTSAGSTLWGESSSDTIDFIGDEGDIAFIDYTLSDSATTITFDEDSANTVFTGVSEEYPGYLIIPENGVIDGSVTMNPATCEIMKYTAVDQSSPWREISGITRGVFNTTAQEHVGTALNPLLVMPYLPGSVQTIEYEPEDEVYAVNVAIPYAMQWKDPLPQNDVRYIEITEYRLFRFEFSKHLVDLVIYQDTEYATSIAGWIQGFSQRPVS